MCGGTVLERGCSTEYYDLQYSQRTAGRTHYNALSEDGGCWGTSSSTGYHSCDGDGPNSNGAYTANYRDGMPLNGAGQEPKPKGNAKPGKGI